MIVGIDLGTTDSLVGAWVDGAPRLFADASGSVLTPSCVSKRFMGTDRLAFLGREGWRAEELSALVLRALAFERADGGWRVFFSQLLGFRGAIDAIGYGVDRDEPDRAFAFEPAPATDGFLSYEGLASAPLPAGTKHVTVRARFRDGSVSRVHRCRVPAG